MNAEYAEPISPARLAEWLAGGSPPLIVDVLPEPSFQAARLPGACNACVFEVAFVGKMKDLAPDPSDPVVLYGASARSKDVEEAARKLAENGFSSLHFLVGGLEAWRACGMPLEGNGEQGESGLADGSYRLDRSASYLKWEGRNLANGHEGTVGLGDGEATVVDGRLAGGCFVVDMTAIRCTDIEDKDTNRVLIDHLESDDFFLTSRFPRATFVLRGTAPIANRNPGLPDTRFFGTLGLRGVDGDLEFEGTLTMKDGALIAQTQFDLDRTRWRVLYGSGRFFERLGMHLVNDLVSLRLKIVLKRDSD